MLFTGLVGLWGTRVLGGTGTRQLDRAMALIHGFGMLLVLVGGFGMLARMGIHSFPLWVWIKLIVWLALGGSMVLAKRRANWGLALLTLWMALGGFAAYLGIFKPS
jgi:hypothetical protein